MLCANDMYRNLLKEVSVGAFNSPRNLETVEVLGYTSQVNMTSPIVTIPDRKLDYQFMAAEAHWIMSGSRTLDHPALKKNLIKYSDDGMTMRGAYGPPFLQQVEYVVEKLRQDPESRQAVITLWERSPRDSKDIPCTVAMQFLIRGGRLHTNVFMRSSDAWLGWPYDVFTFTMMSNYVRLSSYGILEMGVLRIFAGSQHLYADRLESAKSVYESGVCGDNLVISLHRQLSPRDLLDCLGDIRNESNDYALEMMRKNICL